MTWEVTQTQTDGHMDTHLLKVIGAMKGKECVDIQIETNTRIQTG